MELRNVTEEILTKLDGFIANGGVLPGCKAKPGETPKVNVAGLCRELGLKATDAQHFFKKDAIKATVNALALEQDLEPLGVRTDQDAADKATQEKLIRTATQARKDAQAVIEVKAQYRAILKELENEKSKSEELRLENISLKERLALVRQGIIPRLP